MCYYTGSRLTSKSKLVGEPDYVLHGQVRLMVMMVEKEAYLIDNIDTMAMLLCMNHKNVKDTSIKVVMMKSVLILLLESPCSFVRP